jgi:molecular chaperone Hsp33
VTPHGRRGRRWVEGQSLIGTVEDVELIDPDLSGERLLYRLFHERGVRVFKPLAAARAMLLLARCGVAMLKSFDAKDRAEMVKDGKVVVTCEFCSSVLSIHAARGGRGVGQELSRSSCP